MFHFTQSSIQKVRAHSYSMFDPQSPLCLTSVSAQALESILGPGTVGRSGLQRGTVAQAWAQTWVRIVDSKYNHAYYTTAYNQEVQGMWKGCLWPKRHKISHKKVSKVSKVMFSMLFSIVLRPRCSAMTCVQGVTVLRPSCSQSNVSAGQQGRRDNRAYKIHKKSNKW